MSTLPAEYDTTSRRFRCSSFAMSKCLIDDRGIVNCAFDPGAIGAESVDSVTTMLPGRRKLMITRQPTTTQSAQPPANDQGTSSNKWRVGSNTRSAMSEATVDRATGTSQFTCSQYFRSRMDP